MTTEILSVATIALAAAFTYRFWLRPMTMHKALCAGSYSHPGYVPKSQCLVDDHKIGTKIFIRANGRLAIVTCAGSSFKPGCIVLPASVYNVFGNALHSTTVRVTVSTY